MAPCLRSDINVLESQARKPALVAKVYLHQSLAPLSPYLPKISLSFFMTLDYFPHFVFLWAALGLCCGAGYFELPHGLLLLLHKGFSRQWAGFSWGAEALELVAQ